ncbi:MAG: 2-C-methyl-D-erythritol 2,4-cyclodiphosphate synthase [Isosphaeraceae bacterium]|jgi:2-C-methyl-D-erythritol 2,4-cyclodiphosphate synthase|nr:MAG: 2-C-methyl-D-erythritol 2,4-cyclodiphosphate synthase [Isosphaeraceae bacterium]
MRVGLGQDTHRLVAGRPLVLGGVRIAYEKGLEGHSDADVVLHAVADALLGAAALGDIGEHFPDTDPKWKDADSGRLLDEVLAMVAAARWSPVNLDVTIHAEAPKLGPYKAEIRSNLARRLGLEQGAVNVKAKTGERVGPIGRGEAIAVDAVVLLQPARA